MILDELDITNFCQHRRFRHKFHPGMTGILGPNGAGKSNLINAIRFFVTGDSTNSGVKAADVHWDAQPGDPAYVDLSFVMASHRIAGRRYLQGGTSSVHIGEAKPISGETPMTATLLDQIGMSAKQLLDIVWVPQEVVLGFIMEQPAKRNEMLQKLCGLEPAAIAYEQLGKHRASLVVPEFGIDRDALDRDRLQLIEQLAQKEALRSTLPDVAILDNNLRAWESMAGAIRRRDALQLRLQQAEATLQSQQAALDGAVASRRTLGNPADAMDTDVVGQQITAWEREINAWDNQYAAAVQSESRKNEIQTLEQTLQLLNDQLQGCTPAEESDRQAAEINSELQRLAQEIGVSHHLVNSIPDGASVCPTCLTPVAGFEAKLVEAKKAVADYHVKYTELATRVTQLREQSNHVRRLTSERGNTILSLERAAAGYQEVAFPVRAIRDDLRDKVEVSRTAITNVNAFKSRVAAADRVVRDMEQAVAIAENSKLELSRSLSDEMAQLAEDARIMSAAQVDAYVLQARQLAEQARNTVQAWHTELMSLQLAVRNKQEQLQQAIEIERKQVIIRQRIAVVDRAQAKWHKDGAPKLVLEKRLAEIAENTNTFLELFEAPFRVRAGDQLNFSAMFSNGKTQPANRLSPGLKVVLALAVRVALHRMRAGNVNLLCLDEPTVWLDQTRVKAIQSVLGRLHDYTTQQGLQVVIVTHEASLAPLFDSVIQL